MKIDFSTSIRSPARAGVPSVSVVPLPAVKPAPDALIRNLQRSFVGGLSYAAFLSLCVNLLLLTVPLFMMQVQDRVTVSRSYDTLTMLLVIAVVGAVTLARHRRDAFVDELPHDDLPEQEVAS